MLAESPARKQWERIGIHHHHGICIPLFSLVSANSCGIGEYSDLIPLIDWCADVGMDVVQVLPLNDTGNDTSPYNSLSAIALNPMHISLSTLPSIEQYPQLQIQLANLQKLNITQRVKYAEVIPSKEKFLREYCSLTGAEISKQDDYKHFVSRHQWLFPYALFKTLKKNHNGISWEAWPENVRNPSHSTSRDLLQKYESEISFEIQQQYLAWKQLSDVKIYANSRGVFLKGDIPILLNMDSVDVWMYRSLFDISLAAGAPPDMYSKDGQYWGFPIYNWQAHQEQNYTWWIERLHFATDLYDIYRIDHVVGFFRIWAIPRGEKTGRDGHFEPIDPAEWIPQGKNLMQIMLLNSIMLPIGEDLGTVPPEVRGCLRELGICGTKVMRWERRWEGDRSFIPVAEYPPESMTTVSTHDSEPVKLWWRDNPVDAREYAQSRGWTYNKHMTNDQLKAILYDSHHSGSLFHINLLNEYLSLYPELSWLKLEDERVNLPGVVSDSNWTYRFRPTVEQIVNHPGLRQTITELVTGTLWTKGR